MVFLWYSRPLSKKKFKSPQFLTNICISHANFNFPAYLTRAQTGATVTNVTLPDYDLDETQIGGEIFWGHPADTEQVTHYLVYFGDLRTYTETTNLSTQEDFGNVSIYTNLSSITVLPDTALRHVFVFVFMFSCMWAEPDGKLNIRQSCAFRIFSKQQYKSFL